MITIEKWKPVRPMHRRYDMEGGQTGVRCVCKSLSFDKCHTLCESMYNIVEHIVQYLVLVKFLYFHVTAYLNDLVVPVLYQDSTARGPAVVDFVLLIESSRFIS